MGEAIRGEILLSPKVFDLGKKQIIGTLIEEYSHIDSASGDKTRKFQDYLINQYIKGLEEKTGIYL